MRGVESDRELPMKVEKYFAKVSIAKYCPGMHLFVLNNVLKRDLSKTLLFSSYNVDTRT